MDIKLFAGYSSNNEKVYEIIPAELIKKNEYKILSSPGITLGIAKNDRILYSSDGTFKIISRGGYICLQLYISHNFDEQIAKLIYIINTTLKGSMDGLTNKQIIFSIPVESGFDNIEKIFNTFITENKNSEWYYGNVYEIKDGKTPLNWWIK